MRLVTFEVASQGAPLRRSGALVGSAGDVIDLALARAALLDARGEGAARTRGEQDCPSDLLAFLRGGEAALEAAREALEHAEREGVEELDGAAVRHEAAAVRLLPPLPRPNSLRNFSLIEAHLLAAIETLKKRVGGNAPAITGIAPEWYKIPAFFKSSVEEIYGPEDAIPWPGFTDKLDYELEIGAVIGKTGRNIAAADAASYIVGYTIYNDWSARDFQQREMSINLGPGLCKDFASSIGPCIATPDEFDRDVARLTARVNGEQWTESSLTMRMTYEEVIEWITQALTIVPGDILSSGTVAGGCGIEFDRWMPEGSIVELEAEGIGILRNHVGTKGAAVELPASQRAFETGVPEALELGR
jgi:2-keto-4-pentenoate hydratase/2-oxohepta-3-ene-1,7-dioic acid hydratase in catechol pathway